ncbi:hypothetical protein [Methylobacter tundripaludum]|uniref:Uncharacterized protein n=1 Tax=Methylobacter tundripaludum (strain ATCC BAA-1195 / DSM 17260 / SV96) TaxID=697282 RepID=G3ISE3_METTV|nr:hypothetical protein [Methylobacter tundripaludum]EGW22313.1 hypothetical protein Mettu_1122 [Methylobacter tundripaludum SV96]
MTISSYWKNRDKYSLLAVAYIAIGEEPQLSEKARQSESAKLTNIFEELNGLYIDLGHAKEGEFFPVSDFYVEWQGATEIIDWLNVPGVPNFLTEPDEQLTILTNTPPAYLDPKHPAFSDELSIAIQAWNAVLDHNPDRPKQGSRKKLIEEWLETHYQKTLSREARIRIATLLNPDKNGGAPSSD